MPGRPARQDDDPLDPITIRRREVEPAQAGGALIEQQAPAQRGPDALRLLADLLEHEVPVATQLD